MEAFFCLLGTYEGDCCYEWSKVISGCGFCGYIDDVLDTCKGCLIQGRVRSLGFYTGHGHQRLESGNACYYYQGIKTTPGYNPNVSE